MVIFNSKGCLDICLKNTNKYVLLAVEDLRKDFVRVSKLGKKPAFIDAENDFCLVIEENQSGNALEDESFIIRSEGNKIKISANSYLGTIWGIYTFSEKILGVNPCYLFNDLKIEKQTKLIVDEVYVCEQPQQVGFRGVMINDEDFLTGWKEGGGLRRLDYMFYNITVSHSVMEMVVETMLRLKFNLVIPASFLDIDNPYEKVLADCVAQRGIFISQHHVEPLGVSHYTFENYCKKVGKEGIYSFSKNPELMDEVWRYYVRKWSAYENVIWQLGLRGKADRPVWEEEKPSEKELKAFGQYISNAISKQKSIVLEETKGNAQYFTSTLWMEGSLLMEKGCLDIDDDIITIFADIGTNQMFGKDYDSVPRLKNLKYGIYYHLNYYGLGPHLAPQTGLDKLHYNIHRAFDKGDSAYCILNVGNVREFVFEIEAYSEMLWGLKNFSKENYLEKYCSIYGNYAEDAKALLKDYFDYLPVLETKYLARMEARYFNYNYDERSNIVKNFVIKEGMLFHLGMLITADFYKSLRENGFTNLYQEIYAELKIVLPKWEMLIARFERLKGCLQGGVKRHLEVKWLLYAQTLQYCYQWCIKLYEAKLYCDKNDSQSMIQSLQEASRSLEEYLVIRKKAEYGNFKNWYRGDLKMNVKQRLFATKQLMGQTVDI